MRSRTRSQTVKALLPLVLVQALIVGCGSRSASSASSAASSVDEPLVLPSLDAGTNDDCAPSSIIPSVAAVVAVDKVSVRPDGYRSDNGLQYLQLEVGDATLLAQHVPEQGLPAAPESALKHGFYLMGAYQRQFADTETLEALIASPSPVILLNVVQISDTEVMPVMRGAATLQDDGSLLMLGPCGERMDPAIRSAATRAGQKSDAAWLMKVADPSSAEAVDVSEAFEGGHANALEIFKDTPPAERDLTPGAIPPEARDSYEPVALVLQATDTEDRGGVAIRTPEGHSQIIDITQSSEAVTVVMVPLAVQGFDVVYFSPDFKEVTIARDIPAKLLDGELGARLTVVGHGIGLEASVSTMVPGELEKLTGLSRAELNRIRDEILDS